MALAACGRKGPPLPPLVYVPAPVGELAAKRLGSDVVLQFKIPTTNTDNSSPADLDRIEVYGRTGPPPAPADFLRYGTLIATIPVKAPQPPASAPLASARTPVAPEAPSAPVVPAIEQGWLMTVTETLTAAQREVGPLPFARQLPPVAAPPQAGTASAPPALLRYYVVMGVSRRNRKGAFAGPLGVPLVPPPPAVDGLTVTYTQDALSLAWTAPSPVKSQPAVGFNVYQAEEPGASAATSAKVGPPHPPVNPAPLPSPSFTDRVEFGARRCYVVRTVTTVGAVLVESDAAAPVCVTPRDTFAPAAPRQLAAVSDENGVSLIWESNTEADLAGYIVLRSEAPGDTLTPLVSAPIRESTYHDSTVQPGRTYVYAVVALDTATPPNVSEQSNRATEVVR